MQKYNNKTIPVVVLGKKGVGKTSLIESFGENPCHYPPAPGVGIDFKIAVHNNVRIQFYDICGEINLELCGSLIPNPKTALLAFDLSEYQNTIKEFRFYKQSLQETKIIFVGCKSDQADQIDQQELIQEIQNLEFQVDRVFETSSINKQGQTKLLDQILEINKSQINTDQRDITANKGYCCC